MNHPASIAFGLLLFIALGCQKNKQQVVGRYSIGEPTVYERFIYSRKGVRNTVAGSGLMLNPDSTLTYTTCGNAMVGRWKIQNQLLLLLATSNQYRIDSLNLTHACTVPNEPLQYEMDGNKLYRVLSFASGSSLELLSKK